MPAFSHFVFLYLLFIITSWVSISFLHHPLPLRNKLFTLFISVTFSPWSSSLSLPLHLLCSLTSFSSSQPRFLSIMNSPKHSTLYVQICITNAYALFRTGASRQCIYIHFSGRSETSSLLLFLFRCIFSLDKSFSLSPWLL